MELVRELQEAGRFISGGELTSTLYDDLEEHIQDPVMQDKAFDMIAKLELSIIEQTMLCNLLKPELPAATIERMMVGAALEYAVQYQHFAPIMGTHPTVIDEMAVEFSESFLNELIELDFEETKLCLLPMLTHAVRVHVLAAKDELQKKSPISLEVTRPEENEPD